MWKLISDRSHLSSYKLSEIVNECEVSVTGSFAWKHAEPRHFWSDLFQHITENDTWTMWGLLPMLFSFCSDKWRGIWICNNDFHLVLLSIEKKFQSVQHELVHG